jgi:hypothetical protein
VAPNVLDQQSGLAIRASFASETEAAGEFVYTRRSSMGFTAPLGKVTPENDYSSL